MDLTAPAQEDTGGTLLPALLTFNVAESGRDDRGDQPESQLLQFDVDPRETDDQEACPEHHARCDSHVPERGQLLRAPDLRVLLLLLPSVAGVILGDLQPGLYLIPRFAGGQVILLEELGEVG